MTESMQECVVRFCTKNVYGSNILMDGLVNDLVLKIIVCFEN